MNSADEIIELCTRDLLGRIRESIPKGMTLSLSFSEEGYLVLVQKEKGEGLENIKPDKDCKSVVDLMTKGVRILQRAQNERN